MKAPEWTPGPWSVGPWIDSLGGHVYRVVKAANRNVSSVSVYGKRSDGTTGGQKLKDGGYAKTVGSEECDANANLIAAAPELYEALDHILHRVTIDDESREPLRRASAALARARGEAA